MILSEAEQKMLGVGSLAKSRLDICCKCPKLKNLGFIKQCSICGCEMTIKTKLPKSTCPDNPPRW